MRYSLLVVALLLAACQPTPEELAAQEKAKQEWLDQKCLGYGFKKGTKDFASCKMQVEAAAAQSAIAAQQAQAASSLATMQLLNASQPQPMVRPMTTCTRNGNMVNCW